MLYEALSRIQFAFTLGFHIIWPSFIIGLCVFLFICELLWLKTKDKSYISIYMFWSKIFALSFAMGVVTGVPLSFQFGTNFAKFSQFTAPVIGPLLSIEILTAFFLEAVFIGIMLFGWKKVPPLMHLFATGFVMLGTHNSALWILVISSWMHTPAGVEIIEGILSPTSWHEIIFNPSMPYRLAHTLVSSYVTTLFVVLGISATYIRRNKSTALAKKSLFLAFKMLIILLPLQVITGHTHSVNTLQHQPAKVAAMHGQWETSNNTPFLLFAITNSDEERNWFEFKIPRKFIGHSTEYETKGLKEWSKEERPSVGVVFWSFRIMLIIGFVMLGIILWGTYLAIRKRLYENKAFLRILSIMTPSGFIAILAGWIVTEVGRQPWSVYGLLRISEGHSPITTHVVAFSLTFFAALYCILMYFYTKFAKYTYKKGMPPIESVEVYQKIPQK